VNKFANVDSFTISGGNGSIAHTTIHHQNFGGEGTEGGAVSGLYRIDWGYFSTTTVTITFVSPVDAVGAFFGGDGDGDGTLTVTYEGNTTQNATVLGAGLGLVPNESTEFVAINGFLGIDGEGVGIVSAAFTDHNDAASLDSIFFGTATGGLNGAGPTQFPENFVENGSSTPLPEPSTYALCLLTAAGLAVARRRKLRAGGMA
jgi:hypothetical protein